jgi:hypothetical protein
VEQQSSVVVHDGIAGEPAETADHHCFFVTALGGLACLEDLDLAAAELPWCRIWLRQFEKMLESARCVEGVRQVQELRTKSALKTEKTRGAMKGCFGVIERVFRSNLFSFVKFLRDME